MAERAGRILRLGDGVVLLPTAPALAMRELSALAQPFTTSQARQALDTTRRVAIPLLENLDARGWTTRVEGGHRRVNHPPEESARSGSREMSYRNSTPWASGSSPEKFTVLVACRM